MTLWDILSNGERIIVHSDEGERLLYTWNQSVTLSLFYEEHTGDYEEIDVRTLGGGSPASFKEAREAAIRWANGV